MIEYFYENSVLSDCGDPDGRLGGWVPHPDADANPDALVDLFYPTSVAQLRMVGE